MNKQTIGNVTLYCGDSLELLRAGMFGKIGAIVSDPPYGMGYQHNGKVTQWADGNTTEARVTPIVGDNKPFDPSAWLAAAPRLPAGTNRNTEPRILLWGADYFRARLPEYGSLLAWDKHLGRGGDDSFADCEWAWCGRRIRREVFRYLWKGVVRDRSQPLDTALRLHVSQKPVELMRWSIAHARPLNGLPILDPYMGSGSTLVAAMTLGLSAIGCEIDPEIFALACERVRKVHEGQGLLLEVAA